MREAISSHGVSSRTLELPPERLLALHARDPQRYPALLESVARGSRLGRFDLLFAHPLGVCIRSGDGAVTDGTGRAIPGPFLTALDHAFARERTPASLSALPFTGGWLIFVGYELVGEIEPHLRLPRAPATAMEAIALRVPAAIIYEHAIGRAHLVAEEGHAGLLDAMQSDLLGCATLGARAPMPAFDVTEDPPERFLEAVGAIHEYIAAGDVYQVNLSRGWRARATLAARAHDVLGLDLYRALREANPAPFAASFAWGNQRILSSSPERLFAIRGGEVTTRPIAGTRPRSRRAEAEAEERTLLVSHPKERAEHVMLIDLERNDLGRICVPGSVHVDEFMALESYEHVHHIVSNVRGRLVPGTSPAAVLHAIFPGGTITGCPKFRCMQIIAELEGVVRGAYTGSLGYINRDGTGDFNILIRTMTVAHDSGEIAFRAGAGIVADSIAERELDETRAKARGLLRALARES